MTRKFSGEKLVIATHNQGKLEEIRHLFEPFKINIIGANQLNITEPDETEDSFVGNARIKACLLYTSPSPRDMRRSRMPSSA